MGSNRQKLELTWIGKENRPKLDSGQDGDTVVTVYRTSKIDKYWSSS